MAILGGCAGDGVRSTWRASDIEGRPTDSVSLQRHDKSLVTMVSRSKVQQLHATELKIEQAAGVRAEVLIVELSTSGPNAFAWRKDGVNYISVSVSMLDLLGQDQDQYAALFGHELGHLVKNHMSDAEARQAALQGTSTALSFIPLPLIGALARAIAVPVAATAINAHYSRDQEREADALGVTYMVKAGYDPQGAVRLQQNLLSASKGSSSLPFLNDHPTSEERIRNIQTLIDQQSDPSKSHTSTASQVKPQGDVRGDTWNSPSQVPR